jgi:prepilin-type processing-associated H-X9-DG protein
LILPARDGDRLIIKVDHEILAKVADLAGPPWMAGRERARRVQSANNIRHILQGMYLYANGKKEWPDDLQTLVKMVDLPENSLLDPRRRDRTHYIYIRPKTPFNKTPGDVIVLHEQVEGAVDSINVGFADGHVEWMQIPRFQEELQRQKGR